MKFKSVAMLGELCHPGARRLATKGLMMRENCTVLLVENNPDDARLAQLAFERGRVGHELAIVADGEGAMQFLKAEGQYKTRSGRALPKLILLDLGMPGVSGLEFLEQLRREPVLREIPVTILSGSSYSPDVKRAQELGARSFLEKTADLRQFTDALKAAVDCVLGAVSPPPRLRLSCG
ncbi:MAG TPA: response regulator [Verrucomicrobiae bacterium]|nr:response regulator [Verrucomicrobiae bacterium]